MTAVQGFLLCLGIACGVCSLAVAGMFAVALWDARRDVRYVRSLADAFDTLPDCVERFDWPAAERDLT